MDRSSRCWIVRDPDGNFWQVPSVENPWDHRQPFQATGGKPKPGAKWKFALCRYDYSVYLENTELTSTAPLTRPDFHRYEDYGELTFVK